MTDLRTFRSALEARPDQTLGPLDIDQIMARGGSIRRRRRVLAAVVSTGAAAVLVTGGVGVVSSANSTPTPGPTLVPAAPGGTPPSSFLPEPKDKTETPDTEPVLGEIVHTGLRAGGGERVLYALGVREAGLPRIRFGVMAGRLDARGQRFADVFTNETEGLDRSPGFHALSWGPEARSGADVSVFGYFVGNPAKITATVRGRTVAAGLARWSEDRSVVFFWFSNRDLGSQEDSAVVTATDAAGTTLDRATTAIPAG